MKYAVEMGSGAMIYVPSLIKICSGIQKLMGGGGGPHIDTRKAWRSHKPTLLFKNKESRLQRGQKHKLHARTRAHTHTYIYSYIRVYIPTYVCQVVKVKVKLSL
jgi:hypothetical protein